MGDGGMSLVSRIMKVLFIYSAALGILFIS